jgi:AraC-like DNA-binding protein
MGFAVGRPDHVPRGALRAPAPDGRLDARRAWPSARLAAHVHHLWSVRWSLRSPFRGETLPHPSAQLLVFDDGGPLRAELLGVPTGRLCRSLAHEGQIVGVSFRPAMAQPLLGTSMASVTDRAVPLEELFGPGAKSWAQTIYDARHVDDQFAITEALLAPLLPPPPPRLVRLRDLVERMAHDQSLRRVEDVCARSGLDARSLQRLFRAHVGVSPKWVLQRYRLHEAAMQLTGPDPPSLAALAASLGYADQAHFCRDFKQVVGQTPRVFRAQARAPRDPVSP